MRIFSKILKVFLAILIVSFLILTSLFLVGYFYGEKAKNKLVLLESKVIPLAELEKFNRLSEEQTFWADLLAFNADGLLLKQIDGQELNVRFKDGYIKILGFSSESDQVDPNQVKANIYDNIDLKIGDKVLVTLNSDNTIFSLIKKIDKP